MAIYFLPAAAALLLHAPALLGGWIWDDWLVIGRQLRAFNSVGDVVFPPAGIPQFSTHYYRPLTTASYLLDRFVFGERTVGFHATSIVANALAATLVFLLARSFLPPGRRAVLPALVAGLLFAAHPVHAESVDWITGRADVLSACAVLGAMLALRLRPLGGPAIGAAAVLFAVGCLFKEVAFALVPIVPLFAVGETGSPGDSGKIDKRALFATGAIGAAAAGILALRAAAMGGFGADVPRQGLASSAERLGGALAFYLPRAVLPLPIRPYADAVTQGPEAWAALLVALLAVGVGSFLLARPAWRAVGVGLVSFFVFLLPSLIPVLLRVSNVPLAERYLYLPTVGLAVAAAGTLYAVSVRGVLGRTLWVLAWGACLVYAATTLARTRVWSDEIRFWTAASESSSAAEPRIHLGTAYEAGGDHASAEAIYRRLLAGGTLEPARSALVEMNLGIVLRQTGRVEAARAAFERSARLNPSEPLVWFNLASLQWDDAMIDPNSGTADRKKVLGALEAARRAASLSPFDPYILLLRGRISGALGLRDEAREALRRAVELDPQGEAGRESTRLLEASR